MPETLRSQVDRLANVIMFEIPGEPSQNDGAIDTAIRLLRENKERLDDLQEALPIWKGQPDLWERVENWLFNAKRDMVESNQTLIN